ncbi:Uncharacterized protein Fot_05825 [Forsythia ovata]|uniref:Uncharacterized protein n=1 Tax=Forsythia ovata TaxID=205694 RepID=A0ABD1WR76_9LAMI
MHKPRTQETDAYICEEVPRLVTSSKVRPNANNFLDDMTSAKTVAKCRRLAEKQEKDRRWRECHLILEAHASHARLPNTPSGKAFDLLGPHLASTIGVAMSRGRGERSNQSLEVSESPEDLMNQIKNGT